jgi:hypothetical protein
VSRLHPFDYAFGTVAETWFPEMRDEAARTTRNTADQAQFLKLHAVQRTLGELSPEQGEGTEGFLTLLYSAYRFWEAGRRTRTVSRADLEPGLDRDAPGTLPEAATYLQLPERWFWSRVHEHFPHEPLDGLFLAGGAGARDVLVVGVLGVRADRGGYSQISATATPDEYRNAARAAPPPRFAPAMEGGAIAGFRSVNSNAELVLLASLALAAAKE